MGSDTTQNSYPSPSELSGSNAPPTKNSNSLNKGNKTKETLIFILKNQEKTPQTQTTRSFAKPQQKKNYPCSGKIKPSHSHHSLRSPAFRGGLCHRQWHPNALRLNSTPSRKCRTLWVVWHWWRRFVMGQKT